MSETRLNLHSRPAAAWLGRAAVGLLTLLLLIGPLIQGLYLPHQRLLAVVAAAVLFLLAWEAGLRRRDRPMSPPPLVWCLLALAGLYWLSLIVAVAPRAALEEALLALAGFAVGFAAWRLADSPRMFCCLVGTVAVGALLAALPGFLLLLGIRDFPAAYSFSRFSGALQYPNSMGALALTGAICALALARQFINHGSVAGPSPGRVVSLPGLAWSLAAWPLLAALVLSQSRLAWLVALPAFIGFALFAPRRQRWVSLLLLAATGVAALAAALLLGQAGDTGRPFLAWEGLAAGLVLGGVLVSAAMWLVRQPGRRQAWTVALCLTAVVLATAAAAVATLDDPIVLAHDRDEDSYVRWLWVPLPGGSGPGEYSLVCRVKGEGDRDQPWAWSLEVVAADDAGARQTLCRETGKATGEWQEVTLAAALPPGMELVGLSVRNHYSGTAASLDAAWLTGPSGVRRPISLFWPRVLSPSLWQRFRSLDLSEFSAQSRFQFIADALRIVGDRPLLGAGGGGWASLYYQYQSFGYWSQEVHSHPVEVWVETGTPGFLALLAAWGLFLAHAWRLWRRGGYATGAACGATVAAAALGLHSVWDFNLSLPALGLILFALWGAVAGLEGSTPRDGSGTPDRGVGRTKGRRRTTGPPARWWVHAGPAAAVAGVLALAVVLLVGFFAGQRGVRALQAGDVPAAATAFQQAVRLDPLTPSFHMDLALCCEAMAGGQGRLAQKALSEGGRAVALDPQNPRWHRTYGWICLKLGESRRGLEHLERALALNPYNADLYGDLARAYWLAARALAMAGLRERAMEYADRIAALEQALADRRRNVPPGLEGYHSVPAKTPLLSLALGQRACVIGDQEEAIGHLSWAAGRKEVAAEANLWLAWATRKAERPDAAATYLQRSGASEAELEEVDRTVAAFR